MGIFGASPPSRRLKVVVCNAVDYDFAASGVKPVPQFVNAPRMGLVGYHNHRGGTVLLPKRAADYVQFITGVDDRGIEDADRFCGDTLAAENLIIEICLARIMYAHFQEHFRLRARTRQPDFTCITSAIKRRGFQS